MRAFKEYLFGDDDRRELLYPKLKNLQTFSETAATWFVFPPVKIDGVILRFMSTSIDKTFCNMWTLKDFNIGNIIR